MVPADYVVLDRLPLSPAGKVDRKALPVPARQPEQDGAAGGGGRVALHTPAEELLAGVWAEVLGISREQLGAGDDFFRLGGHSLLAVRVAARLRDLTGVELPLARLLRALPAGRAGAGDRDSGARRAPAAGAHPASAAGRLGRGRRGDDAGGAALLRPGAALVPRPDRTGERHLQPAGALRLTGRLEVAALAASLGEVRRRHEVLRTVFVARDGGPRARVAVAAAGPGGEAPALPVVDLSGLPLARRRAAAARLIAAEARRPFDLAVGPLLRAALLRLAGDAARSRRPPPRRHVLLLTLHHMVATAASLEVLARELAVFYTARRRRRAGARCAARAAHPVRRFRPLAARSGSRATCWRPSWTGGASSSAGARGEPPQLDLPLDRPRPAVPSSRGARRALGTCRPPSPGELAALAQRHGATLFMTLLAAFATLL